LPELLDILGFPLLLGSDQGDLGTRRTSWVGERLASMPSSRRFRVMGSLGWEGRVIGGACLRTDRSLDRGQSRFELADLDELAGARRGADEGPCPCAACAPPLSSGSGYPGLNEPWERPRREMIPAARLRLAGHRWRDSTPASWRTFAPTTRREPPEPDRTPGERRAILSFESRQPEQSAAGTRRHP
jgi:hypothetical protein